jgi:hypothetical protein
MHKQLIVLTLVILIAGIIVGCSNVSTIDPVSSEMTAAISTESYHQLWGLWQFTADPEAGTLDVVPLRATEIHVNVLPFLEPPPFVNLSLESLEFNGNIVDAGIGLRHPFLGLTEFTGFDVCGILITNGNVSGFSDTNLVMAGDTDTRLLNPDGLTRWWNPAEFPVNTGTMFGYNDGLLGAPDSLADYNCTLNGYKYFCDDLETDDPLSLIDVDGRGMFTPGQKNVRHFTIELGTEGLIFNYAVDACWEFPSGDMPWVAPDDFGENANRQEAYRIEVTEAENSLYNDGDTNGGDLGLSIDVYDWYNADLNTVIVESPGNFGMQTTSVAMTGGLGYSTYEIDINDATPAEGSIDLLISIESDAVDYGGLLLGETVTAYFMHTVDVEGEAPGECDPPTTPVIVDPTNSAIKTTMTVDTNNVIHMAYVESAYLYWSYSVDCGQTWVNMGVVATPGPSTNFITTAIDMASGITEPYVYIVLGEQIYNTLGPKRMKVGRMPISPLGSPLEIITAWDHPTVSGITDSYSGAQIAVLADDDIMITAKWKYPHRMHYFLAHDFSDFSTAAEYEIYGTHLNGGSITYSYGNYTVGLVGDSVGNCYFVDSGYHDNPNISGTNYGSFILKYDETNGWWDWEYGYHHSGSVAYWDNHANGLYIDESDNLYYISEYQVGGSGSYGNNSGTYSLTFNGGVAGTGTYSFIDPVPDLARTVPIPYTDAMKDYEYLYANAVADSTGLCYFVYMNTYNDRTVYYITYDGTDWNHTLAPVQISSSSIDAFIPIAKRGYEDWVYVCYTDYDGTPGDVYFVGIQE